MIGLQVEAAQGSINGHGRCAQAGGMVAARRRLIVVGATAALLAVPLSALAQTTTLPPVTVEGTVPKSSKASPKSSPAPASQAKSDVQPAPESAEARDKARSEAVYTTPAAVSTAGRGELATFGQIDTGDVLRTMPGTFTRENPQNPGIAVNIRGLEGSGRVNMMIDGVRQNFRFTGHEAQGFAYVDPALIAGIDVARGAISTAGGAGALVGAANIRTLDVEDIIKPGHKTGVLSTLTYGTNGVGWQEMLATGVTNGSIGIAGAISHREPNNYRNGEGTTVPFTHQDLISGLFKMNLRLSSEQMVRLGAQFYDNDFFANSYFQNIDRDTYTLSYIYRPHSNPLVDLALNAYSNRVRMEYFHDSAPTSGSPPLGTAAGRVIEDSGKGFDVSNTSRFSLGGGVRVAATYGYEYFADDVNAFNRLNPSAGGGANPSGESNVGGAFSQTTFSYGIFDFIAGLRYDHYRLQGQFDTDGPGPGTTFTQVDRSNGRLNPRATLAAQVLPWLQPYVTYSEAFRAPTVNETLFGGSHPGGGAQFAPNPFLEPEIQKGWEFGANVRRNTLFRSGDVFRFKALYFNMDVENYITGCGSPTQFCNSPGVAKVQGVELQGMYDAGGVFAGLSYTFTDTNLPSQLNGAGAHSYLPEHILTATGGLRFLDQKLTVGARVSYFSESYVGDLNFGIPGFSSYGGPYMPGYTLVDLFTSYKFDNGLEIGATVVNLFNTDYTPALTTPIVPFGPTTPTNCFGSNLPNCSDYGRGRTFLFTARAQF